jgi:hypothetical protein
MSQEIIVMTESTNYCPHFCSVLKFRIFQNKLGEVIKPDNRNNFTIMILPDL